MSQEARRKSYLARQKECRSDYRDRARSHSTQESEMTSKPADVEDWRSEVPPETIKCTPSRHNFRQGNMISYRICCPEWMLEVPSLRPPEDAMMEQVAGGGCEEQESWFVLARPKGISCLLSTGFSSGMATCFSAGGMPLMSFKSLLPKNCVLEVIWDEESHIIHAVDILEWKGQCLIETTCEFRCFWLHNKLSEHPEVAITTARNQYPLAPLDYRDCTQEALASLYFEENRFVRDGLLFYHKFGHYQQDLSPLVLLWKDDQCSPFLPPTSIESNILVTLIAASPHTAASAGVSCDGEAVADMSSSPDGPSSSTASSSDSGLCLCTLERIALFMLPPGIAQANALVRCRIAGRPEDIHSPAAGTSAPALTDLQVLAVPGHSTKRPDSWSKILFLSRRSEGRGISFDDIVEAAPVISPS